MSGRRLLVAAYGGRLAATNPSVGLIRSVKHNTDGVSMSTREILATVLLGVLLAGLLLVAFIWRSGTGEPCSPRDYYDRARSYRDKGDFDKAIADCTAAIRLRPNYADAFEMRARTYERAGDLDKAIADCDAAIHCERRAAFFCVRAYAYQKKGNYEKAIAECTIAIQIRPDDALTYCQRALVYESARNYERALGDYAEAIRRDPTDPIVYRMRGMFYKCKGEQAKADEDFAQAKKLEYKEKKN